MQLADRSLTATNPLLAIAAFSLSLLGTFLGMSIIGFTINQLTLFAMVLSIGIVVDDAIVVVENIERGIEKGLSPREAAYRTMEEVGGALISIALVLCAVFVPTAFTFLTPLIVSTATTDGSLSTIPRPRT
mgnify:CR=1 FL=1